MSLNKKKIFIGIAIAAIVICTTAVFVIKNKKVETPERNSSESITEVENANGLEPYQAVKEREQIKTIEVKDMTGLCSEEELNTFKDLAGSFADDFMRDLFNYNSVDTDYTAKLSDYYADKTIYPGVNSDFITSVMVHFKNTGMISAYNSMNMVSLNVKEKEDTKTVLSIRGIVNSDFQTDSIPRGSYDTVFRSSIIIENGECKMLNVDLVKIFEEGVTAYWEEESHTTVQFKGIFIDNWNIGSEEPLPQTVETD